ncbi:hypothetical protein GCM10010219_13810 [Streptomyces netropsis]|nr:hypothetical protein GCM10010219_13810 [Streptomyces netropsis]
MGTGGLEPVRRIRPGGRACLRRRGIRCTIPERNRAEATRYDKLAVRYEATVLVATIDEWL